MIYVIESRPKDFPDLDWRAIEMHTFEQVAKMKMAEMNAAYLDCDRRIVPYDRVQLSPDLGEQRG
jgi:hypothetical protein